ncbi:hypothetical protein [[Eubacterium] cellulosolvens]
MKYDRPSLKTHKLKFSGMIELKAGRRAVKDSKHFLAYLDSDLKKRKRSDGYYIFSGGLISPTHTNPLDSKYTEIAFRFKNSKLHFLDRVIDAAVKKRSHCRLNFALRSEGIDFSKLRKKIILDNPNQESDNFGGTTGKSLGTTKINAYPQIQLITITSEFEDTTVKPSSIINDLFEKE